METVEKPNGIKPGSKGELYQDIFERFKALCAAGKQPSSFAVFCRDNGVSFDKVHYYMKDNGLNIIGLPGYRPKSGGVRAYQEIPFEDVIFEEAGFIPAPDPGVITVNVERHVKVCFPQDTDVAVIARFVKYLGKEAGHVES